MKASLVVLTLFLWNSSSFAQTCAPEQNPALPDINTCKDGEGFIVSEKNPHALTFRCGPSSVPQWRLLKTCHRGKLHNITIPEFIAFANSKKDDASFLQAMNEIKLIDKATSVDLEKYLESLREQMRKSATAEALVLNDDGELKELPALDKVRQLFSDWRKETSVSATEGLSLANMEKIQKENETLLKELNSYSCESPKAKEILKKIKVPVARFSDNYEQAVMPLSQSRVSKTNYQTIVMVGQHNKGGLFEAGSPVMMRREVSEKEGVVNWVSDKATNEVTAVRYVTMEEAGSSIYKKVDNCMMQRQLKSLTGLPASGESSNSSSSSSGSPVQ